jgi:hypothetical protein
MPVLVCSAFARYGAGAAHAAAALNAYFSRAASIASETTLTGALWRSSGACFSKIATKEEQYGKHVFSDFSPRLLLRRNTLFSSGG